jgi:hypothetical protein
VFVGAAGVDTVSDVTCSRGVVAIVVVGVAVAVVVELVIVVFCDEDMGVFVFEADTGTLPRSIKLDIIETVGLLEDSAAFFTKSL